ncbi:Arc family DNA-binding protein [Xanthobacter flavus]|uniref:Arc family DNA-binding protein n=1 Tax=Xanthobacter flavus TaxID=281 RepID=UPI00372701B3
MPTDQFALRFPPGLRDRIKMAAAANRRSMNAEIVIALEKVFGDEQGDPETPASLPVSTE